MARTRQLTPLGRKIKIAMIDRNITARELALRIGRTEATVSEVLVGKNKSEETKLLIMRELGMKVGVEE